MYMYLNYLQNWPNIPSEFHDIVRNITMTESDELHKFVGSSYDPYKLYPISSELKLWLQNNIPIEIGSCCHVHVITSDLDIHKDYMQEKFKVNYIFTTGGENVKTNFYDDDLNLLESHVVPSFVWHWFDGTVNHNATNISFDNPRVAITIGTNNVNSTNFRSS